MRPPILSPFVLLLAVAVAGSGTLLAQAEPATSGGSETEAAGFPESEAQEFLGYWMLSAQLGDNEAKMGLILDGEDGLLEGTLVSPFGQMEAESFRREGPTLSFDLVSGLGRFVVDVRKVDGKLQGRFADSSDSMSAEFTGAESDRVALQRFLVPENETRIARGEQMVRLRFAMPPAGERDFEQVASLEPGKSVRFLEDMAIKLTTDYDLRFGDVVVPKENIVPDYPGVYSLWLKRTADGWSLVFNEKPDVWGTQHDPATDVAEVPLAFGDAAEPSETLVAKIEETESGALMTFTWGPHRWSTPFEIVGGEGEEAATASSPTEGGR